MERPLGAPELGAVTLADMRAALGAGLADMRRAPLYGLIVAAICAGFGAIFGWITLATGHSYWLIFAAVGFPLFGPFAAVALYEVSHRLEAGEALSMRAVFGVVVQQTRRQLPSLCAVIVIIFLFWFFLAHMIFALFLGLSTMTNVSSSFDVYATREGLTMLGFGSVVGAGFALLLFSISVFALPMLLDREVDFVTAMLESIAAVKANALPMLLWGALIAGLTFAALLPAFLGLFLVLPLLGHASWHLYRRAERAGAEESA